jgi:SAM-dependent methyltransferase
VQNKNLWDTYDWSHRGEEWTRSEAWKQGLIRDYLEPNIPERSRVVEIGPGGGRWTDVLYQRASHVTVVDVSETALSICRQRFQHATNVDYVLSPGDRIPVESDSVDTVWSYDVFVHINALNARGYVQEIARILRPGGRAVIHHPGTQSFDERRRRWRSDLTDAMVVSFAIESGLLVQAQTREYVNDGDVMSILEKPR